MAQRRDRLGRFAGTGGGGGKTRSSGSISTSQKVGADGPTAAERRSQKAKAARVAKREEKKKARAASRAAITKARIIGLQDRQRMHGGG